MGMDHRENKVRGDRTTSAFPDTGRFGIVDLTPFWVDCFCLFFNAFLEVIIVLRLCLFVVFTFIRVSDVSTSGAKHNRVCRVFVLAASAMMKLVIARTASIR